MLAYVPVSTPEEICKPVAQWDGSGAGWRLNHPMGLAWSEGFLYVADAENGAVKKLRDDGTLAAQWNGFGKPVAVAAARDAVYVADFLGDHVVKLNPQDGAVLARFGQRGGGPGEFDAPSGIAVDGGGFVYVTEFYNHCVQKLTGGGTFVGQWGTDGRGNGRFHYPTDVAASPTGEVIVADAFNRRIQKFSPDGGLLGAWGNGALDERPLLKYAAGVAVAGSGTVYVSDFFENRIWKLDCR